MNEKVKWLLVGAAAGLAVALASWLLFGRTSVPSNGSGIDDLRNEHQGIGQHQQAAESYVAAGEVRLGRALDSIDGLQEGVSRSEALLSECEQVIGEIRRRGKVEAVKN